MPAQWLSELTGCEVWLKVEGMNPTGSFKDRGMTMAISKAAQAGAKAVDLRLHRQHLGVGGRLRRRAGMIAAVLVPEGKIAHGQARAGDRARRQLLQVDGNFDDCLRSPASWPSTTRWRW